MLEDIKDKKDLEILFDLFYNKAINNKSIGYFFTKIVPINLKEHLPVIVSFWENNLFFTGGYKNNLVKIHQNIHQISALKYPHYDTWIQLLNESVDELFKGENAERLKTNALSIATVMKIKVK